MQVIALLFGNSIIYVCCYGNLLLFLSVLQHNNAYISHIVVSITISARYMTAGVAFIILLQARAVGNVLLRYGYSGFRLDNMILFI